MRIFSTLLICCFLVSGLLAQSSDKATIFGKVTDIATGQSVEFVTVYIKGTSKATETNAKGEYSIEIPTYERVQLVFTRIGYKEAIAKVKPMSNGGKRRINVSLAPSEAEIEVEVTDSRIEDAGIVREEVTELKLIPSTTGNLESVLPSIALGTNSGTGGELSSQYQVRGGNYDENLVYVNDFEIYRPQLIRAGQQEGLTFPNIDLTRDLSFSSGGFQAKYGDKLSSVLDIRYKRPDSLRASVGASFLGGSAHLEGSFRPIKSNEQKVRYLFGARYKTTRYLLGSLDTKGEYIPNFADIQTYITYDINRDWQVGIIGNYNRSEYRFIPTERNTGLGLIDFALQLFTVFEGQEVDDFTTYMGGASLTYLPDRATNPFYLKFLTSTFQINENERFDIIGDYLLGQVESDLGSDNFGEIVGVLGTGTQQQFVRNYLTSNVTNVEHKGGLELQVGKDDDKERSHFLQWGLKFQHEQINDQINEWERLDSAGYSLNYDTSEVQILTVFKTRNNLSSNRLSAYFQDTWSYRDGFKEIKLSAGVRAQYWDLNGELIVSPRAQLLYKPVATDKDISYRLAAGLYYQPPFYRELRRINGTVNTNVQAQKSLHVVGGLSYDFFLGRVNSKKFRLIMEAYYKRLWDMVSYDIDNVRIRYSGDNNATGYVAGFDMRINGEFVPGAESWINLSFLRARESLDGVQHLQREIGDAVGQEVNDVPRPTDRFMNLSMFFQDYLPKNEDIKMHLNLTVGTGLPYGIPNNNVVYRNTYRFGAYHRVDIGFAIQLWKEAKRTRRPNHPLRFTRSSWLSLEIFNLLQVANEASATWIKAVNNVQYSVPNFLTSRRINLRVRMDF
ncbi:MAG: TonB-dependent receptor [Bacteroidota bacterium]